MSTKKNEKTRKSQDPELAAIGRIFRILKPYTLDELEALPTISSAQTCDLKVEDSCIRIWLAGTTTDDGEPCNHKATVEKLSDEGCWETVEMYDAKTGHTVRL